MPDMLGTAPIGLTVRDNMDVSARRSQSVFGLQIVGRFTEAEQDTPRVLLYELRAVTAQTV